MQIFLSNPRSFCAGVNRAVNILDIATKTFKLPIYVFREIVHNSYVVKSFEKKGVVFVKDILEVPKESVLIFSAHGVSRNFKLRAYDRKLTTLDATCPLVTKVHMEVIRASNKGYEVIVIGHRGHPEIEGIIGQYSNKYGGIYLIESLDDIKVLKVKNKDKLHYVTQTTLSIYESSVLINELYNRFPKIVGPHKSDICYATINRQKSVINISSITDVVLIIGSKNSSNSNRLLELSIKKCKRSYLIDSEKDIKIKWLSDAKTIGISSSASSPEELVWRIVKQLMLFGARSFYEIPGNKESVIFDVPKKLKIRLKMI